MSSRDGVLTRTNLQRWLLGILSVLTVGKTLAPTLISNSRVVNRSEDYCRCGGLRFSGSGYRIGGQAACCIFQKWIRYLVNRLSVT
jgi:hypothetical protein